MRRIQGPYALAADAVIFLHHDDIWYVLLVQRGNPPFKGYWALPGGFLEDGETLLECARRELYEETGLTVSTPGHLVGVYDNPGRDPRGRVIGIVYTFVINGPPPSVTGGDDAAHARWFPVTQLPSAIAFDHAQVLYDASTRVSVLTGLVIPTPRPNESMHVP